MSVISELNRLLDYAASCNKLPTSVLVPATERHLRKQLRLKKAQPLEHRGIPLVAAGSKGWHNKQNKILQADFDAKQIDAF